MWHVINQNLKTIDNLIWGLPLMLLILSGGLWLTIRLGLLQVRRLPLALKWMVRNEEGARERFLPSRPSARPCRPPSEREILSVSQLPSAWEAREPFSGWNWRPFLEWRPNTRRGF